MKKLLLITTLLIALVSQGQVQNSTKREKIKNLFALMHQDSLIIKTLDGMAIMSAKYQKDFQQSFMKDVEEITNEITEQIKSEKN